MPKNNDTTRLKMRSKSTRKPLRDVSNATNAVKIATICKKSPEENEEQAGDDALDRLLLAHSDISAVLHQIDELVVQALQITSRKGRKEIKAFADVLTEMHSSLKPWVPRFQESISTQTENENKTEPAREASVISQPKEDLSSAVGSPEPTKGESLVSPSPLVSWRPDCNTDGGRQLFLLTPIPRTKSFLSKCGPSSIAVCGKNKSNEIPQPASLFYQVCLSNDLSETVSARPTPSKVPDTEVTKASVNTQVKSVSPSKRSTVSRPMFVMPPCPEISPPKSCILLEPVSEFCRKKKQELFRSTPFPTQVQDSGESLDSGRIRGQISEDLTLRYPELFGITLTPYVGERVKMIEDSSNWIISPPKTCAIMEPSDEELFENQSGESNLPQTTSASNQQASCMKKERGQCLIMKNHYQDINRTLDITESTPIMKEPESYYRVGKRPGENTLKKELWTKFEAATTQGIRFSGSILQNADGKGFLDRLEEAFDA